MKEKTTLILVLVVKRLWDVIVQMVYCFFLSHDKEAE